MSKDLAALAPPLVVAVAFCTLLFWLLRAEMGGKRRRERTRQKRDDGD